MTVTLTGENSFGLHQELQHLTRTFLQQYGDLAVERIDGSEVELARLHEALTSLPFLASKKLIILREPSTNKQFMEQAEQLLAEVPESTDVIVVEPKLDKRLSYYKYLKKTTDFREFPELDINGLVRWLADTAKQQGGSLAPADGRYLVERVGANQQLLSNELEKLLLYKPKINRQSINLLTELAPQSTIFQLLEAAFAGNKRRTLQLYAEQRALKVEPPQIIAMLAWQLHVLAVVKAAGDRSTDQIAKDAKMSPYVIKKSQNIARQLSLAALKRFISDLLQIDVRSKRTSLNPDEALQNYLLELAI